MPANSAERKGGSWIGRLIKLSRPRFWFYLAGPVLVGAVYGASARAELLALAPVSLFFYFLWPANVLLYGINDIFDAEVDARNPKKDARESRFEGDPVIVRSVFASCVLGLLLFPITPSAAWPWLAGFFFLAIQYSAPPLRVKARPFWDSLSNGLYILPGVAAYIALAAAQPPWAIVAGAWLWTMAMHTFSAIPDIESDKAAGIETAAVRLGPRGSLSYCGLCWLGSALLVGWVAPAMGLVLGIYPAIALLIAWRGIDIHRAYWWYPWINTLVGMALMVAGWFRLAP